MREHVAPCAPQKLMLSCHSTFCSLFFKKEMELSLIGLQNAGKTSLVNVLTTGTFHEDMIPTVGFNMRKHTKGSVTIKLWDLGGQVSSPQSLVNLIEQAGPKMGPSQTGLMSFRLAASPCKFCNTARSVG